MNLVQLLKTPRHFLVILYKNNIYILLERIKLKNNKIFELELQIIINNSLYKKNIIDENTFGKVNEILLKNINILKNK